MKEIIFTGKYALDRETMKKITKKFPKITIGEFLKLKNLRKDLYV
jgi:hypothetical protein